MSRSGFVYIAGAGPGDPDLITVKALRALRNADVILHDRLIPSDLLKEVRSDAVVIDVGKRAGFEHEQQSAIHAFMIDYARQGKTVCRLKGGDPFVFGRGGEEVDALREAGIPFEVIPGVSSAFAAPGAAGIPLTHRKHGHAFMVIAGSKSSDLTSAEWTAAAQLLAAGGSVVVMMGLARLPLLTGHLIGAGCSQDVPSAVISKATWPDERTVVGDLGTIADLVGGLESPAVAVFGKVVKLGGGSLVENLRGSYYHPLPPPETGGGRALPLLFQEGAGGGNNFLADQVRS